MRSNRDGDLTPMGLGRDSDEDLAFLSGSIAMLELQGDRAPPGIERFRNFHRLRVAARIDPVAAYNLGNYMSDMGEPGREKRTRGKLSMRLFERCIDMSFERLRDPAEPFAKAPRVERQVRDIASRAITNIGGRVANMGHPDRAVEHFRQALRIFPDNPNTHTCLGNMGVLHWRETGIDPLEGIREWEIGGKLGDWCPRCGEGCECRATVCRVARQIERDHSADDARGWLTQCFAKTAGRDWQSYVPLARSPADAERLTNREWSHSERAVADVAGKFLQPFREEPLELRVTMAGALMASLARLWGPLAEEEAEYFADEALSRLDGVEHLDPILSDPHWRYVGPPDTDYLHDREFAIPLCDMVKKTCLMVDELLPDLDPVEAMVGVMFHLDITFRHGVSSMVLPWLGKGGTFVCYVPATTVGTPPAV